MTEKNPQHETLVDRSQTNTEDSNMGDHETTAYHYVKHHGYVFDEFAETGESTEFNGIRVIDESGSGESEEFGSFGEMNQSDWEVKYNSAARLSDGTILYEGRR